MTDWYPLAWYHSTYIDTIRLNIQLFNLVWSLLVLSLGQIMLIPEFLIELSKYWKLYLKSERIIAYLFKVFLRFSWYFWTLWPERSYFLSVDFILIWSYIFAAEPGERDVLIMRHDIGVKWPDMSEETRHVDFVIYGSPFQYSAMAATVGFPTAIAAKMVLEGLSICMAWLFFIGVYVVQLTEIGLQNEVVCSLRIS